MYLAQNLKYLREKNGETQKDISKLLSVIGYGFSEMSVSRYESGECEPELKKVILLAEHFNVTIDDLLTVDMKNVKPLYLLNLRFLRKKYSMTQQDISDLLGFRDKSSCCLIEKGITQLSLEQSIKLSEYFGVTLDQLVNQDLSKEMDAYDKGSKEKTD
jgi:transcriptional regulator with XRE-family HTH domain